MRTIRLLAVLAGISLPFLSTAEIGTTNLLEGIRSAKAARPLVLDTPFAHEQEVQSGWADVFMSAYPCGQRFLANASWARLVSPPGTYRLKWYAYAVDPDDDKWHVRLERFVKNVKGDGRLMSAARQHNLDLIVAQ